MVLDFLFLIITYSAGYLVSIFMTALLVFIFLVYNHRKNIVPLIVSVCGSAITVWILKNLFDTARPLNALYTENSPSFPSGHSAMAVALYGFILYLSAKHKEHPFKKPLSLLLMAFIVLIGISRLYLGEHYLQDVVFGYLIGFLWLMVSIRIMNQRKI